MRTIALTQEQRSFVFSCLEIDEGSPSGLRWKDYPHTGTKGRFVGKPAGVINSHGYWQVGIMGKKLKVHRLVYLLSTGSDCHPLTVDHINRNKADNRISNLRLATVEEQLANRAAYGIL